MVLDEFSKWSVENKWTWARASSPVNSELSISKKEAKVLTSYSFIDDFTHRLRSRYGITFISQHQTEGVNQALVPLSSTSVNAEQVSKCEGGRETIVARWL